MSGCDINDVHAPKHAAPSRWLPVGCAVAASFTSAAAVLFSIAHDGAGWWFAVSLTVVLLLSGAASHRRYMNHRLRSLTPHTPAAAGDERSRGDVPALRVITYAGGRGTFAGRGVERRGLRYRLLEARALRAERRTGWASSRRARTTPIDDE